MAESHRQEVNELWSGVTDINILKKLCEQRGIILNHSVQQYQDRLNEWDLDRTNQEFITLDNSDPKDSEILVRNGELSNASDAVKLEALQDWIKKMKAIEAARRQSEAESYVKSRERQDRHDKDVKEMTEIFESILGLKKKPKSRHQKTKTSIAGAADGIEPKEGSGLYYEPIHFFLSVSQSYPGGFQF